MSGINLGSLGQVQAPNYNAAIQAYANSGITDMGGSAFAQALQAGQANKIQQGQLALATQRAEQERLMNSMKIQQEKKIMLSNAAYEISKLPEDKQKDAYNQTVMAFAQQGILSPQEVQNWDKGGKELTLEAAKQSPLYAESIKQQVETEKAGAELELVRARTKALEAKPGKTGLDKPLSSDAAKIYEIANSGVSQVAELREAYPQASSPNVLGKLPTFMQSDAVQNIERLKNDLSDRVGRLRSGGAINADEVEKFNKLLPAVGDSDKTVSAKLNQLEKSFSEVSNSIRPKESTMSAEDNGFMEAQKQYPGMTQEQYRALLSKKW